MSKKVGEPIRDVILTGKLPSGEDCRIWPKFGLVVIEDENGVYRTWVDGQGIFYDHKGRKWQVVDWEKYRD